MKQQKPMKKTPLRRTTTLGKSVKKKVARKASRATLMRNADEAFSLFIRTRDAQPYEGRYFRCISCGRILPIEQADCGHYCNRSHMSLRFSELNCNAQCRHCNRFQEGNIQDYRKGLIKKIGEPRLLLLEAQKNVTNKITNFELELLAKHYKAETKKFKYSIK